MTLRIRIDHGQHAGRTWRLAEDGAYAMGRLPSATLQVLDMKVSKRHCVVRLRKRDGRAQATLEDCRSSHGTLLNGQPVTGATPLKPGDEIRIGLSILRVLSDGDADIEAKPETGGEQAAAQAQAAADAAAGTRPKRRRKLAPDELVGTEIGGYKVLEKIGQGGMGTVYVAEQLSLHREVALKVLNERLTSDRAFVDQFVNEARSAAALNHPNVVQVYDVGRENGRYYFSMEYVPGGSLEEHLGENGAADWRQALNWLIDAANALIFAQKREILHRDVKPDNLMIAEDGSAKLCDLGLAKKAENPDMLAAGIIGTPAFIAPEAIRRKKDIDVRGDLYSLGCTFFRVLTGKNPFPARTVKDILLGHLNKAAPRVAEKKPDVPRELDDVVHRLMAKDPAERFQTPQELLLALDKIRVQHGLEKHGIRPATRKPLIAAGVVVLIGVAALIYALTRPEKVIREEDKKARAEAERQRLAREAEEARGFALAAERDMGTLNTRRAEGNLTLGDNWADPGWSKLVADYRAHAKKITGDPKYGDRAEVKAVAEKCTQAAAEIEDYVRLRKGLDKDIREARQRALDELGAGLGKVRKLYDDAVRRKDWVAAALAVNAEDLAALIQPFVERKVGDVLPPEIPAETRRKVEADPLLDPEKHIQPLIDKHVPGEPPGQALLDALAAKAVEYHGEVLGEAAAARKARTGEGYREAVEILDAYLEALPEEGAVPAKAGPLVEHLRRFREEAQAERDAAEAEGDALVVEDVLHDRVAYARLVQGLRAPGGFLYRVRLSESLLAAKAAAEAMHRPEYQKLTAQVVEDVEALQALFEALVSTYPDGWSKDRVVWTDEKGKEQSARVQGVTATGFRLGGEERTFAEAGLPYLLDHLFLIETDEVRFVCEGERLRGLAYLAELAADYDRAERFYRAYQATLAPDRTDAHAEIQRRMARLPLERTVAEAWQRAEEKRRAVQRFLDGHDPDVVGNEAFWERETLRAELRERDQKLHHELMLAWEAVELLKDPEYHATVWATALSPVPRQDVCYAGERPIRLPGPEDEGEEAPGEGAPPPEPGPQEPPPDEEEGGAAE